MNKKCKNSRNWNQLTNKIYDHQRREKHNIENKGPYKEIYAAGKIVSDCESCRLLYSFR